MKFKYKAFDKNNQVVEGELEADDRNKASLFLADKELEVLELKVQEVKRQSLFGSSFSLGSVTLQQKLLFAKHLSLMIKAAMPINESIAVLADEASGRFKFILKKVLQSIEAGNHLADSLAKFPRVFSGFFVSLVEIGEQSGTLEQSLINLAEHLRKNSELLSKIRGALIYPTIILTAVTGLTFTITVYVLPKLSGFFSSLKTELPWSTKLLVAVSGFMIGHWRAVLLAMLAMVFALLIARLWRPTRWAMHWTYFHIPIVRRFTMKSNLASFCRSMGLMLNSGMTLDRALEIAGQNARNLHYTHEIALLLAKIKKGQTLGQAMHDRSHRFPVISSSMITVGEKSGNLAETFSFLASFYEEEIDNMSKNLSTILEPALLVFIGGVVAFVVMSIITPIYSLTSNVGR